MFWRGSGAFAMLGVNVIFPAFSRLVRGQPCGGAFFKMIDDFFTIVEGPPAILLLLQAFLKRRTRQFTVASLD